MKFMMFALLCAQFNPTVYVESDGLVVGAAAVPGVVRDMPKDAIARKALKADGDIVSGGQKDEYGRSRYSVSEAGEITLLKVPRWPSSPELKVRAQDGLVEQISDLLVKRQRCLLWQSDERLRGLLDRQKEIDEITANISRLIEVLE